jgi:pimeloyl-ACP methyl ester carboxylesterase
VALSTRFGPLPGWSWGDGPGTVLLVHGWAGRGLQLGAFAAPLVARGLRVVTFDAPAHGEVAGRRSSLPELRAAVTDVAHGLGPLAGVIAHSLGAPATLWAAARSELGAARIAVIGPPADFAAVTDRFAALAGFSATVVAGMRRRLERDLPFSWEELQPERLVKTLVHPLLVVHDRDDREVPWTEGRTLAAAAPNARLIVTAGLGHRRILLDDTVIAAVARFLDPRAATFGDQPAIARDDGQRAAASA